jgi:hypothetical protein
MPTRAESFEVLKVLVSHRGRADHRRNASAGLAPEGVTSAA